jgi:ATP-dependent DNA ligase
MVVANQVDVLIVMGEDAPHIIIVSRDSKISEPYFFIHSITYNINMSLVKKKIPVVRRCIRPMLADDQKEKLTSGDPKYLLQEKYDGTRGILYKVGDRITGIMSRYCDTDFMINFPEIVTDARHIKAKNCVLDGEITFFDKNKNPFFLTAAATPGTKKHYTVQYMVFDIIEYEGQRVTHLPLTARLELLKKIIPPNLKHIKVIKSFTDPSKYPQIYKDIVARKGEGVMLKEKKSIYVPGSRKHWIKVKKEQTEDCVVCGITNGLGRRKKTFGALILGQYHNGVLKYVGNVGAGLSDAMLKEFLKTFNSMPEGKNPFQNNIRFIKRWVPLKYVVEVKCMERTTAGMLRLPVFLRVRNDKQPRDCTF